MPRKKKTHEEFIEELKEINPNIEVLGEYKNVRTGIKCKCKVCGYMGDDKKDWTPAPKHLLSGSGCPECNRRKRKFDWLKDGTCEVCGREHCRLTKVGGKYVCDKHRYQYSKHKKFLDANPRTKNDPNEIRVEKDVAYISLYDVNSNKIGEAIIDSEDVDKVKDTKWYKDCGYVKGTKDDKGIKLHRFLLNCEDEYDVDHINHNTLDNRKSNLRKVTRSQNMQNRKCKGYKYVKGKYRVEIRRNGIRYNLGRYIIEEEAKYAREIGEQIIFGEYRYKQEKDFDLSDNRKLEIEKDVLKRLEGYND